MLKYCLSAFALKAFSATPATRHVYRELGNIVGNRSRAKGPIPSYYIERVNRMLRNHRNFGFPRAGDRVLEIGTGWLHWEALTLRLFFDVEGTLYDVWDNRQLNAMRNYYKQLSLSLGDIDATTDQKFRARKLIADLLEAGSFEELYAGFNLRYVVHAGGDLPFAPETFDVVVSAGVLEHVSAKQAPALIKKVAGVMKPGAYSYHSINIRDHLCQYDPSVSQKQYLKYRTRTWQALFNNEVQYINRMQRSDWLHMFDDAGLTLIDEQREMENIGGLHVAAQFRNYDSKDLGCGGLRIVHRKSAHGKIREGGS